jgi:hypothetical protein
MQKQYSARTSRMASFSSSRLVIGIPPIHGRPILAPDGDP